TDANFRIAFGNGLRAGALVRLAVEQRDVRDVNRPFFVDDSTLGGLLRGAGVALEHRDLLDNHAIADDAKDLAALALVRTTDDDDFVAFTNVRHYSTSGAS